MENIKILNRMILLSLVLGIFFMNQYPVIRTIGMILGVFQLFLLVILDGENDWGRVPLYRALYCVNVGMSGGILYPYTESKVTLVLSLTFILLSVIFLVIDLWEHRYEKN